MAETTKNTKYYSALATYVDKVMRVKKTPKGKFTTNFFIFNHFQGLVYIQKWAPNRHAANVAFIAAQAAALKPALPKAGAYFQFAQEGFPMMEISLSSGISIKIRTKNR